MIILIKDVLDVIPTLNPSADVVSTEQMNSEHLENSSFCRINQPSYQPINHLVE